MANNYLNRGLALNDYTIHRKISSGGFSIVYLGYHKDGTAVAIKEYFPNHLHLRSKGSYVEFINMREKHKFQEGLKEFKKEMELVAQIKHPNVIEILNFFEMNGTAYIVMPYEYGMTLSKYISSTNLNESEIIEIMIGVLSAMDMLHENKIIHLDLKPGNIWLRPNKEALILDFGTARILNDSGTLNNSAPMYTPGYAAPEQHKPYFKPENIGIWTDYYALGSTLYALVEKHSPPHSDELKSKNKSINLQKTRIGQVSRDLLKIIEELMQIEIEERKKINLKDIIEKLKKVKTISKLPLIIESI